MTQPEQTNDREAPCADKAPWETPTLIIATLDSAEVTGGAVTDTSFSS